jgi:hypothetical protein
MRLPRPRLGQSKRRSFGRRLYTEAWERGWSHAKKKKVVLVIGAEWICNIADQHFPGAIQIVDMARTGTPLGSGRQTVSGRPSTAQKLDAKADSETGSGSGRDRSCPTGAFTRKPVLREMLRAEADYFERNRHRMRYPKSHKHGLFLGSAVIEGGCKAVIGSRLKPSGMSLDPARCQCHLRSAMRAPYQQV